MFRYLIQTSSCVYTLNLLLMESHNQDLFIQVITDSHLSPNIMVTTVSKRVTLEFPIEFSIKLSMMRQYAMREKQDS